tara:strand:- start:1644 stop:1826 length:183 start_codon:yes stop_codon:yes gene_type:complete
MFNIDIDKLLIVNIVVAIILLIHVGITLSSLYILRNKQGPTGDEGPKGENGISGTCTDVD